MSGDKTFTTNVVNRSVTEHLEFHMTFCFMRNYRTSNTLLSNEICPEVKLGDFNVIFAVITDLKSVLWYRLNFLRNRHILSRKHLQVVGLWVRPGRQTVTKSLFIPQFFWHFQGFSEKKTAYYTECFNKLFKFSWPCSLVKISGPWY